jgi:hypothetical protein
LKLTILTAAAMAIALPAFAGGSVQDSRAAGHTACGCTYSIGSGDLRSIQNEYVYTLSPSWGHWVVRQHRQPDMRWVNLPPSRLRNLNARIRDTLSHMSPSGRAKTKRAVEGGTKVIFTDGTIGRVKSPEPSPNFSNGGSVVSVGPR